MQAIPNLVGTSCAVGVGSAGFVFGQALPERHDCADTYISRSTSLAIRPRSRAPSILRQNRPFSQDCEPSSFSSRFSGFSHLTVPADANSSNHILHQSALYKSTQNLKHSSSLRQIQHQSSTISNATTGTNGSKNNRPVSRRYTLGRQISFRRSQQPLAETSQSNSRSQTPAIDECCGDSVSSNGSWIRRLSRRPLSQHASNTRLNFALDGCFSQASSQPIVGNTTSTSLPPNKLIKRRPSSSKDTPPSRHRALSNFQSFHRPATSHQRSATLQGVTSPNKIDTPAFNIHQSHVRDFTSLSAQPPVLTRRTRWVSFLHGQTILVSNRVGSSKLSDSTSFPGRRLAAVTRRVFVGESTINSPTALIKPDQLEERDFNMIYNSGPPPAFLFEDRAMSPIPVSESLTAMPLEPTGNAVVSTTRDPTPEPEMSSSSRPESAMSRRRSLSMTLSSASAWIARTGSLRRPKRRGSDARPPSTTLSRAGSPMGRTSHYAVATLDTIEASILCENDNDKLNGGSTNGGDTATRTGDATEGYSMLVHPEVDETIEETELDFDRTEVSISPGGSRIPSSRSQNLSRFPMPPTFASLCNGTPTGIGQNFVSPSSWQNKEASHSPVSRPTTALSPPALFLAPVTSPIAMGGSGSRTSSGQSQPSQASSRRERSSTIASSDLDGADFVSADDDTDFRSDDMFDSVRTHTSVHTRAVETPLESIFNDSPPSTTVPFKQKRPSILDRVDPAWDAPSFMRVTDEDSLPTPIPIGIKSRLSLGRQEYDPRLSLDDDFDDDWGDMDTSLAHGLSPPSVQGSMNMHSISANVRQALASINRSNSPQNDGNQETHCDEIFERPLSNLFDWTESSIHNDNGETDNSRPRTSNGKHNLNLRGGRTPNRRAPIPAHIRSQSVPIVNDNSENVSPVTTPKFGTWGLGTKTVSEDWGEDFEFGDEQTALDNNGGDSELRSSFVMHVPASIQASQPSLKVHSGQIRELSLLVNDLKRLCRHGRELNLTSNHQALWEEADGIISLASPDEDELEGSVDVSSSPAPGDVSDHFMDGSFEEADIDGFDMSEHEVSVVPPKGIPRRSSVLLPEDDVFGGSSAGSSPAGIPEINWPLPEEGEDAIAGKTVASTHAVSAPHSPTIPTTLTVPTPHTPSGKDNVRSVAAAVHHSATSSVPGRGYDGKFHFDTTSLKTLVRQASELRDSLAEILREADPVAAVSFVPVSPAKRAVNRNRGTPAFTQMFNEPVGLSPPKVIGAPGSPGSIGNSASPGRVRAPSRLGKEVTVDGEQGISRGLALMTVT